MMAFGSAESVAKDVGDNFVRTVKTLGPEPAPSKEIGEGDFDYFVTVIYPDRTSPAWSKRKCQYPLLRCPVRRRGGQH